ncbi:MULTISPECIES: hypothetical protein [Paraburkholderia]|uniref:hypothetical protein n=1 Tax=Paraburkholderia TaxID=1822464 RepID=UPI00225B27A8|nr:MULTISPECIES: hypothetical protein [Paraburkholderia]MCX4155027.1 hypothetical protein [Paraburkholderia aspalathi]MDN7164437.1 hypothetical protein [Paraburkholderia sp. SECH2]MDQ6392922.1 hypothetical protein [Paraburkholderia aspalathi]
MFHLKSKRVLSNAARAFVCVLMLAEVGTQANSAAVTRAADIEASGFEDSSSGRHFVSDDPVAIRDRMVIQHMSADSPSLGDHVLSLIRIPTGRQRHNTDLTVAHLDRDLTFVVPVQYGMRYQAEKHLLTVNVDLSVDDNHTGILLKKTISGPSGRRLVVAPEARAKGFIQHIDMVELESGESNKTTVRGRVTLSRAAYAEANGDYAIVLMGRLAPPYLSDRIDHSDPTDDEPTDITTRTSRLYVDIRAIWLVSPQRGVVLSKSLHLSK